MFAPGAADVRTEGLMRADSDVHAVRRASGSGFPLYSVGHGFGHGFGTADNPRFPNLHAVPALIAGGSGAAVRTIAVDAQHGDARENRS